MNTNLKKNENGNVVENSENVDVQKKAYKAPTLTDQGTLAEQTQTGTGGNPAPDGFFFYS